MSLEQRIENQIENCESLFIHIKFNPGIELKRNKPNEASWLQLTINDAPITTRLKEWCDILKIDIKEII